MAGERSPDTSSITQKGTSDDDISLREHLQRQLDAQRYATSERIAVEHDYLEQRLDDLRRLLDERYERQKEHTDKAYNEHAAATKTAFETAQNALNTAVRATDTAVAKVEAALQDRFNSQQTAVAKAEQSMEKRFDSVNEFRQQLNDQAHTFMPRTESISRHERTQEQLEKLEQHFQTDIASINRRLDTQQGQIIGAKESRVDMRAWIALGITLIVASITIVGFIAANKP